MYQAGVIGCGWISTAHMNGYGSVPGVKVVAAADLEAQRLKSFGKEWDIPDAHLYGDLRDLLKNEALDILSVCTLANSHAAIINQAVKYPLQAIVCEKPMALSLKDADAMIAACNSVNCALIICHQRRFEKRYVKARELILGGAIGEVVSLATFSGDLFEDGTHAIDLMRYLIGDKKAKSVIGQADFSAGRTIYGHPRDYAALGQIVFEDNIWGVIMTEELMRRCKVNHPLGFNITGTQGHLEISGGNYPLPSWISLKTKAKWETLEMRDNLLGTPKKHLLDQRSLEYFWLEPFGAIMRSVIETLETGKENICRAENARAAIEVVIGIHESARSRKLIEFPVTETAVEGKNE